jgi:ATP-binding cassette subfamily B (MDR/TAP) protein 1
MAHHSTQGSSGRNSKDFGSISIQSPSTSHFSSSSPTTKDVEVEETNARGTWGSLFNFTATPHLWSLILGVLLSIITGLITPAMAIFLGRLLNVFADRTAGLIDDSELLQRVSMNAVYIVEVGSASWLLKGGYFTYWISFGELQAKRVRDKLYDGMLAKDMGWFDTRKAGINAMLPRLQT